MLVLLVARQPGEPISPPRPRKVYRKWILANLDKRCYKEADVDANDFFWNPDLIVPLSNLTVPLPMKTHAQSLTKEHPELAHRTASPKSGLLKLPIETLSEIFQYLYTVRDVASLACLDGRLFAASWKRFDQLYKSECASWAGNRIICIGKDTEPGDFPRSLKVFMKKEIAWMEKQEEEQGLNLDEEPPSDNDDDSDDDDAGSESSYESHISVGPEPKNPRAIYRRIRRHYTPFVSPNDGVVGSDAFKALLHPGLPAPKDRVLCNLSKGLYVREDAIPLFEGDQFNICQALLSRIIWSSRGTDLCYKDAKDPIHRGKWAGDKFEVIATGDRMRRGIKWRDGSKAIVDRIEAISRAGSWSAAEGDSTDSDGW